MSTLHDDASEAAVMAAALTDPATLESLINAGVKPEHFADPRREVAWRRAVTMHASNIPVDPATLAAELQDANEIDRAGGFLFVAQLADQPLSLKSVKYHADRLIDLASRRALARLAGDAARSALDANTDPLALAATLADGARAIGAGGVATANDLEGYRVRLDAPPAEAPPTHTINGVPVCTPGNLTTVLAQAKSGKTAFVGAFISAGLASSGHGTDGDFLGVEAGPRPKDGVVLALDTEQSQQDHYRAVSRAHRRAEATKMPDWVRCYSLAGVGPVELRSVLRRALRALLGTGERAWFVILDGVTDFMADPNSLDESQNLITELMAHASEYDCPIICVIHRNEGKLADPSARGHIGKQLARKAAYNLVLEKDADEVTTVYASQNRGAPILKKDGPRFRFDQAAGMHLSVATAAKTKDEEKADELREIMQGFMAATGLGYAEIKAGLMTAKGCTGRWAEKMITFARKADVIRSAGGGKYVLSDA